MKTNIEILSSITTFMKYAKYSPKNGRRESWEEICYRNRDMHLAKYPELHAEILNLYNNFIIPKKVLPSMRSMQFAGKPIELSPNRIYNCCFLPMDDWRCFSETMFLLLGGTGVGYSVQSKHVESLPEIKKPIKTRRYLIGDSIEGWADAVKAIFKAYMKGASLPKFDFSDIRSKGAALITSGGKAPGPTGLQTCLFKIKQILDSKEDGTQLTTLEVHDLQCHIADAVLTGGIRRAAMISLFDMDDNDMLTCKFGNWWELNPQRGRSNNSAVVIRHKITKKEFKGLWTKIEASGSGEPGIYLSNNADWGTNPCCFTGDTTLLTSKGYKTFKELSKESNIELVNVNGELYSGSVWSTGKKDIVSVKNSLGEIIKCTPDHRFMVTSGEEVMATDLKGNRLMPLVDINNKNDHFTKLGFIQGDGNLTRLNSEKHKGIEVNIGENDKEISLLFGLDPEDSKIAYYINGFNDELREYGFDAQTLPERDFPKTFNSWDSNNKVSFVRGMFSANGCVIKGKRVAYKTTSFDLVNNLKKYMTTIGIECYITTNKSKSVEFDNGSYICLESYDLNISAYNSIKKFASLIGFVHEYKNKDLGDILVNNSPVIISVKDAGISEVFDFNLQDDTHWGVVGEGYIAHNCEIALKPYQFCNLTEINANDIVDQEDLEARAKAASFLGTLQAGYSDFHYIRDIWKRTTEKDALIGVSMTGIASGKINGLDLKKATEVVIEENVRVAGIIGVNSAARTTCVKPAGTTSLVLGSSSGIHAWHDPYYIRRIRVGKNEAIYQYLAKNNPEILEDEFFNPKEQAVISVPVEAPSGATFRNESAIDLLERVKKVSTEWVKTGHIKGENTHNVSATISVKDDEWDEVGNWMWNNRDCYNGLSVLPFHGGTYKQAPFETISKEEYEKLNNQLKPIDLKEVKEVEDNTNLSGEVACGPGGCEVT